MTEVYRKIFILGILTGVLFLSIGSVFSNEKAPPRYIGREYRDPTRNPLLVIPIQEEKEVIPAVVSLPYLSIQGIVWGGGAPRAIIDQEVVAKGDILPEGIEILDISKGKIKVLYRGKIFTLLPPGRVEER